MHAYREREKNPINEPLEQREYLPSALSLPLPITHFQKDE
jgi:hypothetical protein